MEYGQVQKVFEYYNVLDVVVVVDELSKSCLVKLVQQLLADRTEVLYSFIAFIIILI
jgi:hypothetical protein